MNIPSIQNYLYKLSGKRLSGKRPLPVRCDAINSVDADAEDAVTMVTLCAQLRQRR